MVLKFYNMNLTLCALVTTRLLSSPMLVLNSRHDMTSNIKINQVSTQNFFSTFLFSYSNTIQTQISKSNFINFIQTPLVFRNHELLDAQFCSTDNFTYSKFKDCQIVLNNEKFSDVLIVDCTFENNALSNNNRGGAIYFCFDGSLTVFGTFFIKFSAQDGGAIFAAKSDGTSGANMDRDNAKLFLSHYCCYSSCYAKGYGSAGLIAASDLQLNFSSTINCPDSENTADGAQFDLQSGSSKSPGSIASSNINSTTVHSKYCASLEYRNVKYGFFKFQTIVNHIGGFITSFTSLTEEVDISNCNIVNATLSHNLDNKAIPGVIHVRDKNIKVSEFFFFNINFAQINDARLITYQYDQSNLSATLINSYTEVPSEKLGSISTINVTLISGETDITTQFITQLYLGDCQGILSKEPPPVKPEQTPVETPVQTPEETPIQTPVETPVQTPVETIIITDEPDIVPRDPPKQKGGGNKTPLIAGVTAGVVAAVAVGAIVAFFVIRHNRLKIPDSDINLEETNDTQFSTKNPLYNKAADDPFLDDFDN